MGTSHVAPASIEEIVDLVNAWSPVALAAAGLDPDSVPDVETSHAPQAPASTSAEVQALAGRLHTIFLAEAPEERREALNHMIAELGPLPVLTMDGNRWKVDIDAQEGLASLLMGLWIHGATDPDLTRLGACAGRACLDAFFDSTQARTRRYCSNTCQNRAKVAAYRRRQGQKEQSGAP